MAEKTEVLIIGGGVAGLAAGCYARVNGFDTLILEQHFLPGGLCTSWEREGYVFDGCISTAGDTPPPRVAGDSAARRGEYLCVSLEEKRGFPGGLPIHSQMQLSFGVNRDLSDTRAWVIHLLDTPYRLLSEERSTLSVKNFCFDPSLEVILRMDYGYFRRLVGNRHYNTEQDQTAEQVLEVLERIMPGIADDIEFTDVATPIS